MFVALCADTKSQSGEDCAMSRKSSLERCQSRVRVVFMRELRRDTRIGYVHWCCEKEQQMTQIFVRRLRMQGWCVVGCLGAACFVATIPAANVHAQTPPSTATAGSGTVVLKQLGIDPQALAAAGVTAVQASSLVAAARSYMDTHSAVHQAALVRVATARALARRLDHSTAAPGQEAESGAALAAARAELASAEAAWSGQQEGLANAATAAAGLDEAVRGRLDRVRANRKWGLPIEYAVVDRTDEEWKRLAAAIHAVHEGDRPNATPANQESVNLVAVSRAHVEVAGAIDRLQVQLTAIREAWVTAEQAPAPPR